MRLVLLFVSINVVVQAAPTINRRSGGSQGLAIIEQLAGDSAQVIKEAGGVIDTIEKNLDTLDKDLENVSRTTDGLKVDTEEIFPGLDENGTPQSEAEPFDRYRDQSMEEDSNTDDKADPDGNPDEDRPYVPFEDTDGDLVNTPDGLKWRDGEVYLSGGRKARWDVHNDELIISSQTGIRPLDTLEREAFKADALKFSKSLEDNFAQVGKYESKLSPAELSRWKRVKRWYAGLPTSRQDTIKLMAFAGTVSVVGIAGAVGWIAWLDHQESVAHKNSDRLKAEQAAAAAAKARQAASSTPTQSTQAKVPSSSAKVSDKH